MKEVKEITHFDNANSCFAADFPEECNQEAIIGEVEAACRGLLRALHICLKDPQVEDTPKRMAKMLVNELMWGRYAPCPELREFPNTKKLDELYCVGPISIRSMCAHHMLPFLGHAWIGILPGPETKLLGLSKFARLADWVFSRPQIQEEASIMLADEIEKVCGPLGLGVVVKAKHMCMAIRGVKDASSEMTTSVMRGLLRENPALRAEFLGFIK